MILGLLAALSGAIAVAAGAFGAHGASGPAVEWLKTGGQYQLIHAVAALVADGPTRIDDTENVATSFPTFVASMLELGASIRVETT